MCEPDYKISTIRKEVVHNVSYDEAKEVVWNFFHGISQPVKMVTEALDMILEEDYYKIQMSVI